MKEIIYLDSINSCIILERFPGNRFDVVDSETMQKTIIRRDFYDELMLYKGVQLNQYFTECNLIIFQFIHN